VGAERAVGVSMSEASVIRGRAERALAEHASDPASLEDPLLPATLRYLDEATGGRRDRSAILRWWPTRAIGGPGGDRRYRWNIAWDGVLGEDPAWARGRGQQQNLWHPNERAELLRDPGRFAQRLVLPLVLTETLEFLEEAAAEPSLAGEAAYLRDEALPLVETDFALGIAAGDPWRDTFALWQLSRCPRALELLDPLAIAAAMRFAAAARRSGGVVRGIRHPFFGVPLRSASAHLAGALWTLGIQPLLLPGLLEFAAGRPGPGKRWDGGWGDSDQPSDVLTTLVVADLLATLDPSFDPGPVVRFFARHQEPAGWWRALDPEAPWLTTGVCRWLRAIERPFAARFRWPRLARWQRDRKTLVPLFAFYEDLARVAAALPSLSGAHIEVAFLDLIGFGHWNTAFGQEAGDRVLAAFAAALREIPDSLVVRDGGDEFLVVGAPTVSGTLRGRMERFRRAWPERFRLVFGDLPVVSPRIVVGSGPMADALAIRERAGIEVGRIKHVSPDGPGGILVA
jgi:GGDEF domain-containing protein